MLAAGGIGDGRQVAAALALGAQGVWTGSVWLATLESDVEEPVKAKLVAASSRDTVRAGCLTGKPIRQLRTRGSLPGTSRAPPIRCPPRSRGSWSATR